jgi:hypothetical protein
MPHSGSCLAYPTRPDLNGTTGPRVQRDGAVPDARRCLLHGRAVLHVSLTGRGPGASVAEYPLYVRAGKVREGPSPSPP